MKILFITPSGGRTGSEMMLWYYLDFLKNKPITTIIYSKINGSLLGTTSPADFTHSLKLKKGFINDIFFGVYNKLFGRVLETSQVLALNKTHRPDFWYINTILMPEMAAAAVKANVPYVLHAHELVTIYEEVRGEAFEKMIINARKIICCSSKVQQKFIDMGCTNTVLVHSFIDSALINVTARRTAELRQQLDIPNGAFVWGMSGGMNLRKGYDMLPDLLEKMPKNSYFVWIGSESNTGVWSYLRKVAENKQLNFIHVPAQSDDYYDYLNIIDGFVLLSREDPFPLVMLEAAYLQKPIAGFDSGGVSEFLQENMGVVTEGINVNALAKELVKIQTGETKIDKDKLRSRALEFEKERQIMNWYNTINEL